MPPQKKRLLLWAFFNLLVSGWGPYAYFDAVEVSRASANAGQDMNARNVQATGIQIVNQRARQDGYADPSSAHDQMESGKR